jgi:hypothetical protein
MTVRLLQERRRAKLREKLLEAQNAMEQGEGALRWCWKSP